MNPLWRVAAFEYRRNVFAKGFFFTLLSLPFLVALSIGAGLFLESRRDESLPLGYVDRAGVFSQAHPPASTAQDARQSLPGTFISYAEEETAQAALKRGEIQAYYLLPASYLQTRQVEVVYIKSPSENAWWQFYNFLQFNLLADRPDEVAYRLAAGAEVSVRSLDGRRQASRGGPTFGLIMPLFITMAFLALLLISSGYMMGAVSEEKENRTIEVLITSLSPARLMTGKILGIVATSLTLLLTWMALLVAGIFIASQAGIGWFKDLALDWRSVAATVLIAVPAYVLAAGLMIAIGAMVATTHEAQSVSAIFFILHMIPLYAAWIFIKSPHHPLAVLLSMLPFTALVTLGVRNLFTIVPDWQVAICLAVQTAGALAAIWLAGRALRRGLLQYGKHLDWRRLLGKFPGNNLAG